MAFRGAISVGRQANTSLFSAPRYLRTTYNVSASNPFHKSTPIPHYQSGVRFSVRAVNGAAVDNLAPEKETQEESLENWKVKMLYDGECPLCMREVDMLRERNKKYRSIKFVDISSDDYRPEDHQGLDYETVMGRIHAIQSDGTVVTDIEVASMADAVYGFWAKYRLQVTGRPPLEEVLEARRKKKEMCEDSKVCKM